MCENMILGICSIVQIMWSLYFESKLLQNQAINSTD
uniref:Uncharacterized protein n=1 Tax=Anguilla anguilla TaxID=7936 RepID=A0A0E9U453_ANGAN